jgi:hypothetical protein
VSPASFAPVASSAPFLLESSSSAMSPLLAFLLPSPCLIPSRSAWSTALRSGENDDCWSSMHRCQVRTCLNGLSLRAGLYFVAKSSTPTRDKFLHPFHALGNSIIRSSIIFSNTRAIAKSLRQNRSDSKVVIECAYRAVTA